MSGLMTWFVLQFVVWISYKSWFTYILTNLYLIGSEQIYVIKTFSGTNSINISVGYGFLKIFYICSSIKILAAFIVFPASLATYLPDSFLRSLGIKDGEIQKI